jgi:hypothetical protein
MSTDENIKFNGLDIQQAPPQSPEPAEIRFIECQKFTLNGTEFIVERINRRHLIMKPAKGIGYACANGVMQIHNS